MTATKHSLLDSREGVARRFKRAVTVMALATAATACNNDSVSAPQNTTLFVYATFSGANVAVRENGQVLGQLGAQYTGPTDCSTLAGMTTSGKVLSFTVRLGQHYVIDWDYGNGPTGSDQFDASADVVENECLIEGIGAAGP